MNEQGSVFLPEVSASVGPMQLHVRSKAYDRGMIVGVFGHSGAGKTSYAHRLSKILGPRCLVAPQGDATLDLITGRLNIELMLVSQVPRAQLPDRRRRMLANAEQLEIAGALSKRGMALSGGERRRLTILGSLLACPDILILDEPFVGLGARHQQLARQMIMDRRSEHLFTMIISHSIDLLWSTADRVIVLDDGRELAEIDPKAVDGESPVSIVDSRLADVLGYTNIISLHVLNDVATLIHRHSSVERAEALAFWADDAVLQPYSDPGTSILVATLGSGSIEGSSSYHLRGHRYSTVLLRSTHGGLSITAQSPRSQGRASTALHLKRVACLT